MKNVFENKLNRSKSGIAFTSHGVCFDLNLIRRGYLFFPKDRYLFYLSLNTEAILHRYLSSADRASDTCRVRGHHKRDTYNLQL
jgi:hypothetical protein